VLLGVLIETAKSVKKKKANGKEGNGGRKAEEERAQTLTYPS
jgi:hypothetical protein